jgi:hypothetical protein
MERPNREPAKLDIIPADAGWYMAEPMEPRATQAIRTGKFGTTPVRDTKTMVRTGPPKRKRRVR